MQFFIDLQIILISLSISFYLYRKLKSVTLEQDLFVKSVTQKQEEFVAQSADKLNALQKELSDLQSSVTLLKMTRR